jgi:hypothetical protein
MPTDRPLPRYRTLAVFAGSALFSAVLSTSLTAHAYYKRISAMSCAFDYGYESWDLNAGVIGGAKYGTQLYCPFDYDSNFTDSQVNLICADFNAQSSSSYIQACWISYTGNNLNCSASAYAKGGAPSWPWVNACMNFEYLGAWKQDTNSALYTNVFVSLNSTDQLNGVWISQ